MRIKECVGGWTLDAGCACIPAYHFPHISCRFAADENRPVAFGRAAFPFLLSALLALSALLLTGCATSRLGVARKDFYQHNFDAAAEALAEIPENDRNYVLDLMERGMIHHTAGDYRAANTDWIQANERIKALDYLSVSEKTASLVINDAVETYTGAPFERSLMHAFTAKNYFALAQWNEAGVEARLIADGLQALNGFPDDPYSRYVSALGFELIRDFSGAKLEYSRANALVKHLDIDQQSGHITVASTNLLKRTKVPTNSGELICLVALGRTPTVRRNPRSNITWGNHPYVEILHKERYLGRSYTLNTTASLLAATQRRIAAIKAAKTATRIVLKESISHAVAEHDAFLGEVLRIILYAFETPDTRGWETLPMWLQVARVPCPKDLDEFTVVFHSAAGRELKRETITAPITKRDDKHVAFIRAW